MVSSSSHKLLFRQLRVGRSLPSMAPRSLYSSTIFFSSPFHPSPTAFSSIRRAELLLFEFPSLSSRAALFCSHPSQMDEDSGPTSIDYRMLVSEDEFHRLADSTLYDLQEKFEEYGDSVQSDDFDIDFGNQVLTLKLGNLATYVINKQTPNRQIWLSSPVRFLVSFAGKYLVCDAYRVIPNEKLRCYGVNSLVSSSNCEHEVFRINIKQTTPNIFGPAFIEVENESGISNFIPILIGDKQVCSELNKMQRSIQMFMNKTIYQMQI